MIKKLQRKFILITAASLFIVLAVVAASINIINNYQLKKNEDEIIDMLCGAGGKFPDLFRDTMPPDDKEFGGDRMPDEKVFENSKEFEERRDRFRNSKNINEETSYQTRYFVVYYDIYDEIQKVDVSHIAAVDSDQAKELANEVLAGESEQGRTGNYRYVITGSDSGKMVLFLDVRNNDSTKSRFLLISIAISVASWVIVMVLVILLSRRVVKPVSAAYEKQKQFITDASHEIKTPLAIISANTEVIEMTSEPSEWTESTKNQIKRLDGLVKDLMRLSRMDGEQKHTEFVEFDLSEETAKAAAEFEAPARTHNESFELDIDEDIKIVGDSAQIRQLVGIFCDNAVKYCDEGGTITVSLKPHHKGCRLAVTNDCAEPPSGDLSRLFDRFYRADEARTRQGSGGYGIGLSIAKATADAHKAKISCTAENGRITFAVTFK
ncbi:MAG: HAMP domain-containing histidine kinase [Ruminococcus sp.]|nr:HAMP domain-containing histidine kinase [Ruminococcus sp.]